MAVDAEEAGMDAFMDKPFKLEELTAVYIKLLKRDNRNQLSIRQTTYARGDVARRPRLIRNVTPNAKIFVDAAEVDDVIALQVGGDSTSSQQDGTSSTAAVAVPERMGLKNAQKDSGNAKVHAAN